MNAAAWTIFVIAILIVLVIARREFGGREDGRRKR
jgi:hypothetical protein